MRSAMRSCERRSDRGMDRSGSGVVIDAVPARPGVELSFETGAEDRLHRGAALREVVAFREAAVDPCLAVDLQHLVARRTIRARVVGPEVPEEAEPVAVRAGAVPGCAAVVRGLYAANVFEPAAGARTRAL